MDSCLSSNLVLLIEGRSWAVQLSLVTVETGLDKIGLPFSGENPRLAPGASQIAVVASGATSKCLCRLGQDLGDLAGLRGHTSSKATWLQHTGTSVTRRGSLSAVRSRTMICVSPAWAKLPAGWARVALRITVLPPSLNGTRSVGGTGAQKRSGVLQLHLLSFSNMGLEVQQMLGFCDVRTALHVGGEWHS